MPSPGDERRAKGREGEERARAYLEAQGYNLVRKNYRTRYGEIDLIMTSPEGTILVFVEVRSGQKGRFSGYLESITEKKCEKIAKVALAFIEILDRGFNEYRIDAVFVERGPENQVVHLKNIYCMA